MAFEAHPFAILAFCVDQNNAKSLKGFPYRFDAVLADSYACLIATNRHKRQAAFVRYFLHRHIEQGPSGPKLCWRHCSGLQISAG